MSDILATPTFALDLSKQTTGPLAQQGGMQITGQPQVMQDVFLGQVVKLDAQASLTIAAPEPGKPFSITLWVKPDQALDKSWAPLLSMGEDSGPHWAFGVGGGKDGLIWSNGQQPQQSLDLDKPIECGVWSHIALSYDGKVLSLYVNGKLGSSRALPDGLPWPEKAPLYLGTHLQSTRLQKTMQFASHTGVLSAAFSPDGSTIVTASYDCTAKLWKTDGTCLQTLSGHTDFVFSAAFSPDGSTIVTASADSTAKLWKTDGTCLQTLSSHTDLVHSAAFSPDGATIVTGSGYTAKLWKTDGTCLQTLSGHTDLVYSAAFSPDGSTIVTASGDNTAKLWKTDGTCLQTLSGHTALVLSAAFSPDGSTIVTASDDGTAKLWKTDGTCLQTLNGGSPVVSAAFSPYSSQIFTTNRDGTGHYWLLPAPFAGSIAHACIYSQALPASSLQNVILEHIPGPLLDMKLDRVLDTQEQAGGRVANRPSIGVSFNPFPDGQVVGHTGSTMDDVFGRAMLFHNGEDGITINDLAPQMTAAGILQPFSLELWVKPDASLANSWAPILSVGDATGPFWALVVGDAWSGLLWYDGQNQSLQSLKLDPPILPGYWSNLTLTYDQTTLTLYVNGKRGNSTSLSNGLPWPAGKPLQLGTDKGIAKLIAQTISTSLEGHSKRVFSAAFSPDPQSSRVVTASEDGTVILWDAQHGTKLLSKDGEAGAIWSVAFNPDGTQFVTAHDKNVAKVWDAQTLTPRLILGKDDNAHTATVFSAAFSHDGSKIVTASADGTVKVWDAQKGDFCKRLFRSSVGKRAALFSLDDKYIINTASDRMEIWTIEGDYVTGSNIDLPNSSVGFMWSLAFNQDGSQLVSAHQSSAIVWDALTWSTKKQIYFNSEITSWSASFSPDGKWVATAGEQTIVTVWDCQTWEAVLKFDVQTSVRSVAFSSDSSQILLACFDNTAKIISLPPSFAGRMANLRLTLTPPPDAATIKEQVERAILKAATGTVFPLEFSLENDQHQAVLYLGNMPRSLSLLVKNSGRRSIFFDHSGQGASHFELRFRPGTLADPQKISIAPDPKWPGWLLAYHREADGTDVFGFQHTPGASMADSSLTPGESLSLTLTNVQADDRGGSRSTRVQLRYSLQYDDFTPVAGSRMHYLSVLQMPESEIQNNLNSLMSEKVDLTRAQSNTNTQINELWKTVKGLIHVESQLLQLTTIPLAIWAENAPFIINNGKTNNILRLQIGHIGGVQDALKLHNSNGVQTTFRFNFNRGKAWGLFSASDCNVSNMLKAPYPADLVSDNGGWDKKDWDLTAQDDELILKYQGAEPAQFIANQFICLEITFICSLPPGQAYVVVNYENIGEASSTDNSAKEQSTNTTISYPHGHLSLSLIRSPFAAEKSRDGTIRTVVSGKLALVETAYTDPKTKVEIKALPTIEMHRNIWQTNDSNTPDATIGVNADGGLIIQNENITLQGKVSVGDLEIKGSLDADNHTIKAQTVNAGGVIADEYKLSGLSPQNHDYGYVVPQGGIIMWSGNATDIPMGWDLCDGTNGTPNLVDKFIIGGGGAYPQHTSGGQALVTLTEREMPQHAHGVTDPKHKHTLPHTQIGTSVEFAGWNGHNEVYFQVPLDMNKEVDAQGTGLSVDQRGEGQPFPIIPPYYALCFIMKR